MLRGAEPFRIATLAGLQGRGLLGKGVLLRLSFQAFGHGSAIPGGSEVFARFFFSDLSEFLQLALAAPQRGSDGFIGLPEGICHRGAFP